MCLLMPHMQIFAFVHPERGYVWAVSSPLRLEPHSALCIKHLNQLGYIRLKENQKKIPKAKYSNVINSHAKLNL